jgi:hypothetical protein
MPKKEEPAPVWPPAERGVAHLRVDDDDIEPLGQILPPPVVVEHPEPPPSDDD